MNAAKGTSTRLAVRSPPRGDARMVTSFVAILVIWLEHGLERFCTCTDGWDADYRVPPGLVLRCNRAQASPTIGPQLSVTCIFMASTCSAVGNVTFEITSADGRFFFMSSVMSPSASSAA